MDTFASFNLVIFLVTTIINVALGALVVVRQYHNLKKPVYASFIAAIFFIVLWTLFNYLADTTSAYDAALFYTRATVPTAFFMFYFAYVFATFFPVKTNKSNTATYAYLIFGFIITALSPTPSIIKNIIIDPKIGIAGVENTLLFLPVVISYFGMLGHAIYKLSKKLKNESVTAVQKAQIRYTILGWTLFLLAALSVSAVLPLLLGNATLSKLGPLSSVIMVGFATYAIVKHRFLDIRIIIQRGLIYTVLAVFIAGVYVVVLQFFGYLLHTVTNIGNVISATITMLIGIWLVRPLEEFFQRITDPIFFKHKYNYADALHRLAYTLYTSLDEKAIIAHSKEVFAGIFKTDQIEFILDPLSIKGLSFYDQSFGQTTLAYPIVYEDQPVGVVHFGPKRSGDTYTQEDVQLVSTFAVQLAISLGKAKLHHQVQEYTEHLENLVEERTAEIKELQESQKQSMVEISHGLQTPLSVIMAKIEMVEGKAGKNKDMQVVKSSLERVSHFIRQLLHLARLENRLYTLKLETLNLNDLIEEQREYFEVVAAQHKVAVKVSYAPDAVITGDKKLIEELVMNLVANAINYRRAKVKSFVSITLAVVDGNITLTVADNGIGIEQKDLKRIFKRFYRIEQDSTKRAGTGLGLAIVKEIITRHRGSVSVASEAGKGTTFTVTFPKAKI